MRAILLAAGLGKRLKPFTEAHPKCLVEVAGRTLLDRHLEELTKCEIDELVIVVGHLHDQVRAEVARVGAGRLPVRFVMNEDYKRGSIVSLWHARADLKGGAVVMDADVLYHPDVLRRLVEAPFGSGFLLDETSEETGEEMMIGVRGQFVRKIARRVGSDWDLAGETVGFFKVGDADSEILKATLEDFVARGELDCEYEAALDQFMQQRPCGYVKVGDLPWTEIDFDVDVDKARDVIHPRIQQMLGA
ncbi:MAG: phosphocholine cytidylyltransferase family protein [Deltaproteobacteria bacterium]|nr:phosphocholine cytidylyltransferase family protein [Deltaproteobacteria bacterium]